MTRALVQLPPGISLEDLPQALSVGKTFSLSGSRDVFVLEVAPEADMGVLEEDNLVSIDKWYVLKRCTVPNKE